MHLIPIARPDRPQTAHARTLWPLTRRGFAAHVQTWTESPSGEMPPERFDDYQRVTSSRLNRLRDVRRSKGCAVCYAGLSAAISRQLPLRRPTRSTNADRLICDRNVAMAAPGRDRIK